MRIRASIDVGYYARRQADIAELQRRLFAGVGKALTNLAREFLPRLQSFDRYVEERARRRRMHSMYAARRR